MTLPDGHPWQNTAPFYSSGNFLYGDIGSSNTVGGGTALNDPANEDQNINTNFTKIVKHDGTIQDFATPANQQPVNTYDDLDEAGRYNRNNRLAERIRERVKKQICCAIGGESARALNDVNVGWRSTGVMNQVISMLKGAEAAAGTKLSFLILNVLGRDARFSADPTAIRDLLATHCTNLRTQLNNPNLPIGVIGLGPNPPTLYPSLYPNWEPLRTACAGINQSNTRWIEMGDANYATYIHDKQADGTTPDEVHWNAAGHNLIADRVFDWLVSDGVI